VTLVVHALVLINIDSNMHGDEIKYNFYLVDRSIGSCICLRLDLYMSHGFVDSNY